MLSWRTESFTPEPASWASVWTCGLSLHPELLPLAWAPSLCHMPVSWAFILSHTPLPSSQAERSQSRIHCVFVIHSFSSSHSQTIMQYILFISFMRSTSVFPVACLPSEGQFMLSCWFLGALHGLYRENSLFFTYCFRLLLLHKVFFPKCFLSSWLNVEAACKAFEASDIAIFTWYGPQTAGSSLPAGMWSCISR